MAHKQLVEVCNFPDSIVTKESISEVEICVAGVTAIQKTVIDSVGTEVVTYKTTNGSVLATPASFTYGACLAVEPSITVNVPNCNNTTTPQIVDEVNGVYLLNPSKFHTEIIYDVVVANISGTIPYTFTAPRTVSISYSSIVLTNDSLSPQVSFWTDFGDGYNDVGGNPQHTYNTDGTYEIKSYLIATSGNKILFITKEITINAGTIVYNSVTNPEAVNKNYNVAINVGLLQNYCDNTPIGSPYSPNGIAATLQGTAWLIPPPVRDELEDNADYQTIISTPLVQRVHQNFVVTGTTPLVIPAGLISISITKTNNTGIVNISGDNGTNFPLTFNRENFADSVNEAVSTLSSYTITGTLPGTTFKVHIIR